MKYLIWKYIIKIRKFYLFLTNKRGQTWWEMVLCDGEVWAECVKWGRQDEEEDEVI